MGVTWIGAGRFPAPAAGSIAYESSYSTTATITSTRSPSFTLPNPPPANTILVLWIGCDSSPINLTIPADWENVLGGTTDVESDANQACALIHRVTSGEAGASTTSWTLTNLFGAVATGNLIVDAFSGVDTVTATAGTGSTFSSANAATPHNVAGVTPTVTNGMAVGAVMANSTLSGGYSSSPSGWTARGSSTASSILTTSWTYNTPTVNATPIGAASMTPTAGDEYCAITVVLNPA